MESVIWLLILLALNAFLWFYAFKLIKAGRTIFNVPTSKIRSAAQGYIELIGHTELMPGDPIIAPLTRRPCVWYRASVREYENRSRRYDSFERDYHRNQDEHWLSDNFFALRDDTGSCVVDPAAATVITHHKRVWYGTTRIPDALSKRPLILAVFLYLFFGTRFYRYQEEIIEDYDFCYVIGYFSTTGKGGDISSIDEDIRQQVAAWKQNSRILAEFDLDKNGELDLAEWEQLRKAAREEVMATRAQQASEPQVSMIHRPDNKHPFIIATEDPDVLTRKQQQKGLLMLLAAVAMTVMIGYCVSEII